MAVSTLDEDGVLGRHLAGGDPERFLERDLEMGQDDPLDGLRGRHRDGLPVLDGHRPVKPRPGGSGRPLPDGRDQPPPIRGRGRDAGLTCKS